MMDHALVFSLLDDIESGDLVDDHGRVKALLATIVAPPKHRAYVCHPVSAPDQAGIDANLTNARAWLKWFVDHTTWAVSMPWMPYVECLPDTPGNPYRERGLVDDCALIEGHSIVVLVGGRVTSGMTKERDYSVERSINTLDLTMFGYSPPEPGSDAEAILLQLLTALGHTPSAAA